VYQMREDEDAAILRPEAPRYRVGAGLDSDERRAHTRPELDVVASVWGSR